MNVLLVLTALFQPVPESAPSGSPPAQALASIDGKGKLTITYITCTCSNENAVTPPEVKGAEKIPVKVKVANLTVLTAELAAKHVEAFTADGRTISADKLETLLAKERTVLVAMDGKKVDPFHLQLYKDDTIVLVPPANTLNMGGYIGGYGGYGGYPVPVPPPTDPGEPKRRPDDGRKPEDPKRPPDDGRKPG
jgi:hypothetical protein